MADASTSFTAADLKDLKFRGPVRFLDGRKGMAQQDFECIDHPRFGYSWRREDRRDRGRQYYTVDGREVADLVEAARILSQPPDPESPAEVYKRHLAEFESSPRLDELATRAQNHAEKNAAAGPFGTLRNWLSYAGNAWHRGINRFAHDARKAARSFDNYRWLYEAKHAAHETYRLIYLFAADRKSETHLVCALQVRCRDCGIIRTIEAAMREDGCDDAEIDAAKAWTCLWHMARERAHDSDGAFIVNDADREAAQDEADRWAAVAEAEHGR